MELQLLQLLAELNWKVQQERRELTVPGIGKRQGAEEGLFTEEDVKQQMAEAKIPKLSMPTQKKVSFQTMGGFSGSPSGPHSFLSSVTGNSGSSFKGSWKCKAGKGFQGSWQAKGRGFPRGSSSWRPGSCKGRGKGNKGVPLAGHGGIKGHDAHFSGHEGKHIEPSPSDGKYSD